MCIEAVLETEANYRDAGRRSRWSTVDDNKYVMKLQINSCTMTEHIGHTSLQVVSEQLLHYIQRPINTMQNVTEKRQY